MCIDIVEMWFAIAIGQISSNLPETCPYFRLRAITCKNQGILTKLGTCIDVEEIWIGIANRQI